MGDCTAVHVAALSHTLAEVKTRVYVVLTWQPVHMQFEPAQLALQPCSWQACIACVCSSIPTAMNETDTGASAPFVSSQQAQPLQRAQLADASSARAAGINAIPATTTDNTPQEGYDFWHPPQYQPAESSQADLQLSPWETATVFDSGLQPHPGRAHLDTGNP